MLISEHLESLTLLLHQLIRTFSRYKFAYRICLYSFTLIPLCSMAVEPESYAVSVNLLINDHNVSTCKVLECFSTTENFNSEASATYSVNDCLIQEASDKVIISRPDYHQSSVVCHLQQRLNPEAEHAFSDITGTHSYRHAVPLSGSVKPDDSLTHRVLPFSGSLSEFDVIQIQSTCDQPSITQKNISSQSFFPEQVQLLKLIPFIITLSIQNDPWLLAYQYCSGDILEDEESLNIQIIKMNLYKLSPTGIVIDRMSCQIGLLKEILLLLQQIGFIPHTFVDLSQLPSIRFCSLIRIRDKLKNYLSQHRETEPSPEFYWFMEETLNILKERQRLFNLGGHDVADLESIRKNLDSLLEVKLIQQLSKISSGDSLTQPGYEYHFHAAQAEPADKGGKKKKRKHLNEKSASSQPPVRHKANQSMPRLKKQKTDDNSSGGGENPQSQSHSYSHRINCMLCPGSEKGCKKCNCKTCCRKKKYQKKLWKKKRSKKKVVGSVQKPSGVLLTESFTKYLKESDHQPFSFDFKVSKKDLRAYKALKIYELEREKPKNVHPSPDKQTIIAALPAGKVPETVKISRESHIRASHTMMLTQVQEEQAQGKTNRKPNLPSFPLTIPSTISSTIPLTAPSLDEVRKRAHTSGFDEKHIKGDTTVTRSIKESMGSNARYLWRRYLKLKKLISQFKNKNGQLKKKGLHRESS